MVFAMTTKVARRGLTASIGVRLSKQAKDSNTSLQGMINDCRALAARLGADVLEPIHVDDGVSGSIRERPKFLAWMQDGISGRADILIAPHTDRVTREGVNVAAMVLDVVEGKAHGSVGPVRLVTVDGLDSNDEDSFRWRFVIQAEIARSELRRIRERNLKTRARLNEAGRWAGGPVPFGCRVVERKNDEGKRVKYLEADPSEAKILREVARRLIDGQATHAVARWLVSTGCKTRKGNDWSVRTLKVVLLCQASKAHVFDSATWRALNERLKPKGNAGGGGGRPQVWLLARGNGVCGTCGRNLTTARKQYVCANLACPAQVGIMAQPVDDFLEAEFLRKWGDLWWYETRVELDDASHLDEAEEALAAAQAALLASPGAETLASYQAAQTALETAQATPLGKRVVTVATDWTWSEWWGKASVPERAAELRQFLAEPVKIRPGTSVRRRVDLERLDATWMDQVEPVPDYREV
jgi:DNA invertase Pin-like site-specific DNA recombinase